MKLIIDISEGSYNTIKECYERGELLTTICMQIATGTPYEERPQGEWIEKYSDYGVYYRCSNCHKMPPNYECDYKEGAIKTNFCPNCGVDMRGEAK